ncbi:dehydrogenase [Lithospermum erythrorhizon]|uniref:glucose-6-phosphate dehydrogenase (NADP(+)) n=1 Tax=Lithospermum erythrorhizon TaxID=34254 RepID=A0AAV3P8A1_LITER
MSQTTGLPLCWHIEKRAPLKSDPLLESRRVYLTKSADDNEVVSEFLQLVKYVSGSYDTPERFQALDEAIAKHEICRNTTEGTVRRLFYLALPPSVYPPVCKMIKITA